MADKKVRSPAHLEFTKPTDFCFQGPMLTANKLAMSKALGAAFLNHQVEQLEKTVSAKDYGGWRDRRSQAIGDYARGGNNRRPPQVVGGGPKVVKKGGERAEVNNADERRRREGTGDEKDADIVVVDASVLVHAISHVKKWCRDGRQEIVIVPLEGASGPAPRRAVHATPRQPSTLSTS